MKSENPSPRGSGAGRRGHSPMRIPQVPMEWMDPMSWRLPSGKALAEFALQAGFLAPLMLGTGMNGSVKRKRPVAPVAPPPVVVATRTEEVPERSGSFRETSREN
jgi:hypothetical protein